MMFNRSNCNQRSLFSRIKTKPLNPITTSFKSSITRYLRERTVMAGGMFIHKKVQNVKWIYIY